MEKLISLLYGLDMYYITTEIYAYAPNFTPKSSPFANASLDWLLVWESVSDHWAIVRCFHNYWSFGLVLIDPLKDTKCWYLDMDRCHSFAIADGNVSIVSFMVQNRVATKIFEGFGEALFKAFIRGREPVSILHYTRPGTCIKRPLH